MNRTRRIGLATGAILLLVGCGGGAAMAPSTTAPSGDYGQVADAPAAPAAPEAPGEAGFDAPVQPGYAPQAQPGAPPAVTMQIESAPSSRSAPSPKGDVSGGGAARKAPSREPAAAPPADRPGLGTQWGETRVSRITTTPFVRAAPSDPFAMAALFYNDNEGARAMASASGFRRTAPQAFTLAGGAVAVGLRGENGGFLTGFVAGEKSYAVGEAGQRYTIVLRNLTSNRIECVVSVDGLDVLDGQAAAFSKRGYLIDANGELEIDGFRQSVDTVAAFRFGSVRGSYAGQKHGDTRNVGVIGVALFHERGTNPWTPNEVKQRQDANPFPGQFATPPGR